MTDSDMKFMRQLGIVPCRWRIPEFFPAAAARRSANSQADSRGRTLAPQPWRDVGARSRAGLHSAQDPS